MRLDGSPGAVAALKVEHIRYPDNLVVEGMYATISFDTFVPYLDTTDAPPPGYHIDVQTLGELVGVLFRTKNFNPSYFFTRLGPEAKAALLHQNLTFSASDCS